MGLTAGFNFNQIFHSIRSNTPKTMMKIKYLIILLALPVSLFAQESILVISGGGARGAWGGGLAQSLYESGHSYKAVVGTSTGSLLAPLITIDSFAQLKTAYTSVEPKDIFNVNPFYKKGKKKGEIKGFQAFWRILTGRKTLGESKTLKKTIKNFFPESYFDSLKNSPEGLEFIATTVNIMKDSIEFKSSNDFGYEEMVDWMWASANQPVFMSLHKPKDENGKRHYYVDGGIKENIPLKEGMRLAKKFNVKNIDVIIHSPDKPFLDPMSKVGILKLLGRTIDVFSSEVRVNDIEIARMVEDCSNGLQLADEITITFYFMPPEDYLLLPNSLTFEKETMMQLWKNGEEYMNRNDFKKYRIVHKINSSVVVK